MSEPLVYLNGAMTPIADAKISVLDRGFIFGDGIYEVIPIYNRRMFRPAQHMARLFRSLAAISIPNPHTEAGWMELINQVVATHPAQDQMAYLQVTRGVAKRAHPFPADVTPTVFIMTNPIVLPSPAVRATGVACVSMDDKRWLRCEIKSISLLGNVLAAQNAVEHDAVESIQFRDGYLTEASSSNVWVVKNGVVLGPPKDNLILEGIRYGLIEELCAANGITLECRRISHAEVFGADEIILSSATKEVLPVATLDGEPVGSGAPGPVYERLYRSYQQAKAAA
ncbi:MAG: D-amino acid aminotransferase [Pseudomonadota bacterium]